MWLVKVKNSGNTPIRLPEQNEKEQGEHEWEEFFAFVADLLDAHAHHCLRKPFRPRIAAGRGSSPRGLMPAHIRSSEQRAGHEPSSHWPC